MERRIKRVEELGPFEEWGLPEESLSILKKVKADPKKVLAAVRLGSIDHTEDMYLESDDALTEGPWCDFELLLELVDCEKRKDFYCEIISSLEDFLLERNFLDFAYWIENFMADLECYANNTEFWDSLFYPDGTFNHKKYEGISTNVEKKIVRLLQEYWNSFTPEQYCLFSSLLLNWETIDDIIFEEGGGLLRFISSPGCRKGGHKKERERIFSAFERDIYDDFYDGYHDDFTEKMAEIIFS